MTGGLLQLAAYGAQDIYLTGNPQITYFIGVYKRYTNFSIEAIPQYFVGNTNFGQKVFCKIDRIGDLVHQMFLRLDLPDIAEYNYLDENGNLVEFFWINSVGHAIIKINEIEIGGTVIDRQYGLWMEIWTDLIIPVDKRPGFYQMIGKSESPVNLTNNRSLDLYIPLHFWFCRNIGLALPLVALQSHEVRINITFRKYEELIISSTGNLLPTNKPAPSIVQTFLDVDYIFLEDPERKRFAHNTHQYLIDQIQVQALSLSTTPPPNSSYQGVKPNINIEHNVVLDFNHPVKEILWVLQNSTVLSMYPYGGNEWFNFSTQSYKNGEVNGKDTITNGKFILEGQDLTNIKPAKYFRLVVPYQRHTCIPNNFIYTYSFSLKPEEFQPSGTCNFSRIDNQVLYLQVSAELVDPIITIFAINYNVLNIASGMAGIEYSS
jgi:hypothetical protein